MNLQRDLASPSTGPGGAPDGVDEVAAALAAHGYIADEGLATSIFLALTLQRPLLLEGEAGVGKTEVAKVLAAWTGGELIRLQCYEGIDVSQAVYEWDYARQLLHLRAAEIAGAGAPAPSQAVARPGAPGARPDVARPDVTDAVYSERFLVRRPLLAAIDHGEGAPPVLLIDEVDRADDEFEAFLLEVLSDFQVTIPEVGTIRAERPPLVVLTSNRTRELHDALKRRCLYHWIGYPSAGRELEIVAVREPQVAAELARKVVAAVQRLRELDLAKPPGVAETIDWARTLDFLGETDLTEAAADVTLGAVIKERDDLDFVRENLTEITSGA